MALVTDKELKHTSWDNLQWRNINTKFGGNRSTGSEAGNGQTYTYSIILLDNSNICHIRHLGHQRVADIVIFRISERHTYVMCILVHSATSWTERPNHLICRLISCPVYPAARYIRFSSVLKVRWCLHNLKQSTTQIFHSFNQLIHNYSPYGFRRHLGRS
jgi:hypothetical protein